MVKYQIDNVMCAFDNNKGRRKNNKIKLYFYINNFET